jgi:TRAP-type C4-dicarboxylate transport system substrate-binding protein
MKGYLVALLLLSVLLFSPAFVLAEGVQEGAVETVELTLATINPESSHLGKSLLALAESIEEKSDGAIQVRFFGGGQLGDASTLYESVIEGNIDMILSDTGWFSEQHPEFDVLESYYLFKGKDHYLSVLNTPGSLSFFEDKILENPGLRTIMYAGGMERDIISTFRIDSIDDLQGHTMRSRNVPTEMEWWRLLGARPVPVAFQEVYTAVQTGIVEGSQNSLDAMIRMRFVEVNNYIARTQHSIHLGMVVMNNEKFESLSKSLQRAIVDAGREVQPTYLAKAFEDTQEQLEQIREEYEIEITNPNLDPFIERSRKQLWEIAREHGVEDTVHQIFD